MTKNLKKSLTNFLFLLTIGFLLTAPILVQAWSAPIDENWGATAGLATGDIKITVANIVRWLLGLLGLIATIMIIIAGFWWMTAAGNDDKISKAKSMIQAAVIGLIIIIMAWAITIFVVNTMKSTA